MSSNMNPQEPVSAKYISPSAALQKVLVPRKVPVLSSDINSFDIPSTKQSQSVRNNTSSINTLLAKDINPIKLLKSSKVPKDLIHLPTLPSVQSHKKISLVAENLKKVEPYSSRKIKDQINDNTLPPFTVSIRSSSKAPLLLKSPQQQPKILVTIPPIDNTVSAPITPNKSGFLVMPHSDGSSSKVRRSSQLTKISETSATAGSTSSPNEEQKYYCLKHLLSLPKHKRESHDQFKHMQYSQNALYVLNADRLVDNPEKNALQIQRSKKIILALDLDETLVHCCNFDSEEQQLQCHHVVNYVSEKGFPIAAKINVRPHLTEFLQKTSQLFDLVVFTASEKEYAAAVVDLIDPSRKYIKEILSRKHCVKTEKGFTVKDLRTIIENDLENVLLVDNSAHCFAPQIHNGIPILPYYYDSSDNELLELLKFLQQVAKHPKPVKFVKEYFCLSKYSKFHSAHDLLEYLAQRESAKGFYF